MMKITWEFTILILLAVYRVLVGLDGKGLKEKLKQLGEKLEKLEQKLSGFLADEKQRSEEVGKALMARIKKASEKELASLQSREKK